MMTHKKAIALGNFDGIHSGHLAVINEVRKFSCPCALLFDEHSLKKLTGQAPPMLITDEERDCFFKSNFVQTLYIDFGTVADMSPESFIDEIIIKKFNAEAVVCGYNYRFGKNASGNTETLQNLCSQKTLKCSVVGEVDFQGEPVSSTRIRRLIETGNVETANKMLNRSFGFSSEIVHGEKRGRSWGFPTINQIIPENMVMPKFGVYKSKVTVNSEKYTGVTNIGRRPTVGTDFVISETHIIDFDGDIYGKNADIRLLKFIRAEQKFESFDGLARQIKADVTEVKHDV